MWIPHILRLVPDTLCDYTLVFGGGSIQLISGMRVRGAGIIHGARPGTRCHNDRRGRRMH